MNFEIKEKFEKIDNKLEELEPFVKKIDSATTDKEENRIAQLFEEEYQ